jgi:MoaA/NifB/PqqE/SkfB family radical SAM enzyme
MPGTRRNRVSEALTLEESCRLIRDAADAGFVCLEISGEGEPLLSKNLDGIVDCAHDSGLVTTLITNGHILTRDRIERFFERNVTLVVSLFSLDKNQYEADNGRPGSYEKVMRNLEEAATVFQYGKTVSGGIETFRLGVHTTAQEDNSNGLYAIRDFCREKNIFFSVAPLAAVGGGADMAESMLTSGKEHLLDGFADNSIILSRTSASEVGRQVCGTCLFGLNVSYNGKILFDAHAGYEMEGRLGDVRTDSIEDLVARQRVFARKLFGNIKGFCPVRDPEWPGFLKEAASIANGLVKTAH